MIPRIQTKIGQIEEFPDDPSLVGQWIVELYFSYIGSNKPPELMKVLGPWKTEHEAKFHSREVARIAVTAVEEGMGFEPTGKAINMKTNLIDDLNKNELGN
jgi:hypothetical protein